MVNCLSKSVPINTCGKRQGRFDACVGCVIQFEVSALPSFSEGIASPTAMKTSSVRSSTALKLTGRGGECYLWNGDMKRPFCKIVASLVVSRRSRSRSPRNGLFKELESKVKSVTSFSQCQCHPSESPFGRRHWPWIKPQSSDPLSPSISVVVVTPQKRSSVSSRVPYQHPAPLQCQHATTLISTPTSSR